MKFPRWVAAAAAALACLGLGSGPAFAQSAALVQTPTTTDNCAAWVNGSSNAIQASGVKCAGGQVTVSDGAGGTAVLTPNAYGLNTAALLNGTAGKQFNFTRSVPATATDAGDFMCRRVANYTGGTPGFVNPCLYSYTVTSAGAKAFEWNLLARHDNYSTSTDGAENVAAYFQGRKYSTGATWGAVTELYDYGANPTTGSVTDEHDMTAYGTDSNNARVILDNFARSTDGVTATEVGWGIRLNTDGVTTIKNGITFNGHYGNGLNFAPATINQAAIILGDQHALCFDSACLRKKFFQSGVTYQSTPSGNTFSWSDAGQFTALAVNAGSTLFLNSGGQICWDSGSCTKSTYYDSVNTRWTFRTGSTGVVNIDTGGNISALGAISTFGDVMGNNLAVTAGSKFCFDRSGCSRGLFASGGVTYLNTPSGNVVSFADGGGITGTSVNATNALYVDTNGKICLNGGSCSIYAVYNGTSILFYSSSTVQMAINMGTGRLSVAGGIDYSVLPGVTCSGISTSTITVNGGIVTHC